MELLSRHKNAELKFVVPDLFWAEFGNVLWKAVRTGRLSEQEATYGIEKLLAENLPSVSSRNEEIIRQRLGPVGEDAVFGLPGV